MLENFYNKITPVRYPNFFYKSALRRINCEENDIFITFDDGPNNNLTENILQVLKDYNAKASFFCIGNNALKNPHLLKEITLRGHTIGNHSFSHKNAVNTKSSDWMIDVKRKSPVSDSPYFRPPYGKIKPGQYKLLKKDYKIVLWDVLSMDFNKNYSENDCIRILKKYTRKGSILVFHDNPKFQKKMMFLLKWTLENFSKKDYRFKAL